MQMKGLYFSLVAVVLTGMFAGGCAGTGVVPEPQAQQHVLVLGATGKLGSDTVKALLARGHAVTAFVRPSSDRRRLEGLDVSYVIGDLTRDADVKEAFNGRAYQVVIDCSARRDSTGSFYDASMRSVVRWGRPQGVQQIILHSSVGVGESGEIAEVARSFSTLQGERKRIYDSTMTEKNAAERVLKDSGLKFTIIRNWLLLLEGAAATGKGRLTEDLQALGRITRPDLAQLGVGCVGNEACFDRTFNALDDSITPR